MDDADRLSGTFAIPQRQLDQAYRPVAIVSGVLEDALREYASWGGDLKKLRIELSDLSNPSETDEFHLEGIHIRLDGWKTDA